MKSRRLLHTTAMRLAMRYAVFFAVLIAIGLGVLYWASSRYVDAQIASSLEHEAHKLAMLDQKQGRQKLKKFLIVQNTDIDDNQRYFLLEETNPSALTGYFVKWPAALKADGRVHNIWFEDDLTHGRKGNLDGYWPMIGITLGDGAKLLVAQGVSEAEDLQEFTLATMAIILVVSVSLALIMGWRLGRTMLSRIDRVNETAAKVSAGDLSHRIPISENNDEFDELASHLNIMLVRIEDLLTGMKQVTDNVAHDLRKPLTRIQNRIEVTLLESRNEAEYRQVLNEVMVDAKELVSTFNALLEIAQLEAGSFKGEWGNVDLSALLYDICELYKDQAENENRFFQITIESGLTVTGNRQLLAQAITNLLDNAFKFTPQSGEIQVEAKSHEGKIALLIKDGGAGIPAAQRENVLHRFVRLDKARNTSGNGLGLSLVKAIFDLHQATLTLENNDPGLRAIIIFNVLPAH